MLRFPFTGLAPRAMEILMWLAPLALTGCASSAPVQTHDSVIAPTEPPVNVEPTTAPAVPALRSGRYTLIELAAETPQRDLMQQIVDISFPPPVNSTVSEALRYLLLRTGYQLCDRSPVKDTLDTWPLPAAHLHLGPLTLRQALEVLAGPAWTLQVEESTRQVCFVNVNAGGAS